MADAMRKAMPVITARLSFHFTPTHPFVQVPAPPPPDVAAATARSVGA